MRALMCFLSAGALLWPQSAFAQIQPYRAEYALRLGTAVNAARVGSAVQDLTLTCDGWRLKRDVKGEIALSATWKMNLASKLDGEEPRAGDAFRYQHSAGSERRRTRDARQGAARRQRTEGRNRLAERSGAIRCCRRPP